jgi:hypothetical protein
LSHSGQDEEFDKFEKFLGKKSSESPRSFPDKPDALKSGQPKSDFTRTLEQLNKSKTGQSVSDPEWNKFQQFLRHEAAAEQNDNDSGHGESSILPPQLGGLNWGACTLSVVWGGVMKVQGMTLLGWTFLMMLPMVGMVFPLYLLVKGNEIAWKSRRWASIDEFRTVQKKWTTIGVIVIGIIVVLLIAIGSFIWNQIGRLLII